MKGIKNPPHDAAPSAALSPSDSITIQVGERNFTTTRQTLSGSPMLNALVSGSGERNARSDGSFFIDADDDIFVYILRFPRDGSLPLFYGPGGFDHGLYAALLAEARFFQLEALVEWVQEDKYYECVRHVHSVDGEFDLSEKECNGNVVIEYHPRYDVHKIYLCPLMIAEHVNMREVCDADERCRAARYRAAARFEMKPRIMDHMVTKSTMIDFSKLVMDNKM